MKNNITQWMESITPVEFSRTITVNCAICPAKKYCNNISNDDLTCDEAFYKWSLISKQNKRLKSTLTQFFNYLEKRGFIKDDLVFDTEHQIDTYIEQFNNQNNNEND